MRLINFTNVLSKFQICQDRFLLDVFFISGSVIMVFREAEVRVDGVAKVVPLLNRVGYLLSLFLGFLAWPPHLVDA